MLIIPQNHNIFVALYERIIQITDEYACKINCKTIITKNEDDTYNVSICSANISPFKRIQEYICESIDKSMFDKFRRGNQENYYSKYNQWIEEFKNRSVIDSDIWWKYFPKNVNKNDYIDMFNEFTKCHAIYIELLKTIPLYVENITLDQLLSEYKEHLLYLDVCISEYLEIELEKKLEWTSKEELVQFIYDNNKYMEYEKWTGKPDTMTIFELIKKILNIYNKYPNDELYLEINNMCKGKGMDAYTTKQLTKIDITNCSTYPYDSLFYSDFKDVFKKFYLKLNKQNYDILEQKYANFEDYLNKTEEKLFQYFAGDYVIFGNPENDYTQGEFIAKGGFNQVYNCTSNSPGNINKYIMRKSVFETVGFSGMQVMPYFINEIYTSIVLSKNCKSTFFCKIINVYIFENTITTIMDNCGNSLTELSIEDKTPQNVLKILIQIFTGLICMHNNGYVHLDLKEGNILLHKNIPKIIDFGCTLRYDEKSNGWDYGTHGYFNFQMRADAVNDKIRGRERCKFDVYSMGVIMNNFSQYHPDLNFLSEFVTERKLTSNNIEEIPHAEEVLAGLKDLMRKYFTSNSSASRLSLKMHSNSSASASRRQMKMRSNASASRRPLKMRSNL